MEEYIMEEEAYNTACEDINDEYDEVWI